MAAEDVFVATCMSHADAGLRSSLKGDSDIGTNSKTHSSGGLVDVGISEISGADGELLTCKKIYRDQKAARERIEKEAAARAEPAVASTQPPNNPKKDAKDGANKRTDFSDPNKINREGAAKTKTELGDVKEVGSAIKTYAEKNAEAALKRADELEKNTRSGVSAASRNNVIYDQKLARSAKTSVSDGKDFSEQSANHAHDEKIRKHLLVVSTASEGKKILAKEEVRLDSQLTELLKMAGLTANLGEKMSSAAPAASAISNEQKKTQGSSAAVSSAKESAIHVDRSLLPTEANSSAKTGSSGIDANDSPASSLSNLKADEAIANAKDPKKSRNSSLREKISSLLKQHQNEAISGTAQFQEELPSDPMNGSGASTSAPQESGFRSMLSESIREAKEAGFSMPNAEAEAKQFVADSEGHLNQLGEGILAVESSPLFERVTLAYQACLRRKCL